MPDTAVLEPTLPEFVSDADVRPHTLGHPGVASSPPAGCRGLCHGDRASRAGHRRATESGGMTFRIVRRAELRALGYSRYAIAEAVASGQLIRARRDHYVLGSAPRPIVEAVRVGGQLSCLSLLSLLGVFVLEGPSSTSACGTRTAACVRRTTAHEVAAAGQPHARAALDAADPRDPA